MEKQVLELMTYPHSITNPLGSIDSVISYVEVGLSDVPKHCGRIFQSRVRDLSEVLLNMNPNKDLDPESVVESIQFLSANKNKLQTTYWAKDFITTKILLEAVIGKLRNLGFNDIDIFEWIARTLKEALEEAEPSQGCVIGNYYLWLMDRMWIP
ncbi:hypothetical protein [Pasteuria penetrans]|uniref:hypothetical protein n=1 Tax=Pasteuria penetrans TaxID=86005 RepID=UPI000FB01588|nr:hypothetical protein [Pasteuria penetrans]